MADHVQPGATGDEQEVSSSGLLLSVDPLPGTTGYKLSTDDTDATDADASDTTDVTGGDTDASDASDADASDTIGGDTNASDTSDADGTDLGDSEETESGLGGQNPLGINRPERVKNGDDKDTRDT
ncbi:MAG TPA: hypothetical protein VF064_03570 [Pyrinomonadaceae bacterium]